jgi:hypothetical protein
MERRKFIELTGSFSLLTSSGLLFSCDTSSELTEEEQLKSYSKAAFKRFAEI